MVTTPAQASASTAANSRVACSFIAHCQSAADKVKLQSAFLTEMAADYSIESRRLAQGFQEQAHDEHMLRMARAI